jgi:hypothetical protein
MGTAALCVTNLGTLRFMIYDGVLNTTLFLDFLRRLVKGADRKLFVIVDICACSAPSESWRLRSRHLRPWPRPMRDGCAPIARPR